VGLLALGHATVDTFGNSFLSPLLPEIVKRFQLPLSLTGFLATALTFSASLSQPIYGFIADRLRRPWLVILGPVSAALCMGWVGLVPSYALLLTLMLVGGAGIAAYHPQGVVLATRFSGGRKGLGVSVFVTGGALGYAAAPLLSQFIRDRWGVDKTYLAIGLGVVVSLVLGAALRSVRLEPAPRAGQSLRRLGRGHWWPLLLLNVVSMNRAALSLAMTSFLALFLEYRGLEMASGTAVSVFLFGNALGGLLGGSASDWFGPRRAMILSGLVGVPAFYLTATLGTEILLVPLFISGMTLSFGFPASVILAQEIAPENASTVSSLLTGFSWGVGGFFVTPIGALADAYGLTAAFKALAALPVLTVLCAWLLPQGRGTTGE